MRDTFANRMKIAMENNNLRQADIVEKTGIGKSAISQYLSGYCEPKQTNIYKIALALDVSEAWLMGFDVEPSREKNKSSNSSLPPLTDKDERNIQKKLSSIIEGLAPDSGLAFYDDEQPMTEEDKELLRISLENTLRLARQMAKQKFTPKKYRKE